jgi:hypothetical protein
VVRWQGVGMTDRPARISQAEIESAPFVLQRRLVRVTYLVSHRHLAAGLHVLSATALDQIS